jgi:hypothetical protein
MSFTNFAPEIFASLNVNAITSLLDAYGTAFALFSGLSIPEDCAATKTINFYRTAPIDNTIEYGVGRYSASCRAETEAESIAIAAAVVNVINRTNYSGYTLKTSVLMTIPPADETDSYNTPVEISIYQR